MQHSYATETEDRYLEFSMGPQVFALPILNVREVISIPETTPLPGAPKYFEGLMNLRGQIITIIDLKTKMAIPAVDQSSEEAVIVLTLGEYSFGIHVDSINRVSNFAKADISEVPEIETQVKSEFIKGIYQKKEGLVILLNIEKVLNLKDLNLIDNQQKRAA